MGEMAYKWRLITNHLATGIMLQGNLQDWWMLLWFRKFPSGHPYGVARKGCGAHGYLYSARGNNSALGQFGRNKPAESISNWWVWKKSQTFKTTTFEFEPVQKKQQNLENNFVNLVILLMEEIQRSPVDVVVYPIIYRVLYISGGCLGILNHQQYVSLSYVATVRSWPSCGRIMTSQPTRHLTYPPPQKYVFNKALLRETNG